MNLCFCLQASFPGAISALSALVSSALWTLVFGILAVLESLLGSTPLHIQFLQIYSTVLLERLGYEQAINREVSVGVSAHFLEADQK